MTGIAPSDHQDGVIGWREAMRDHALESRQMLLRHPWAAALIESRAQAGPARLDYLETLIARLREGGFSVLDAYRANLMLDSYIYGFVLQEVSWPFDHEETPDTAAAFVERTPVVEYPRLIEIASLVTEQNMDRTADFEFGLDLILDGLERSQHASCLSRERLLSGVGVFGFVRG